MKMSNKDYRKYNSIFTMYAKWTVAFPALCGDIYSIYIYFMRINFKIRIYY